MSVLFLEISSFSACLPGLLCSTALCVDKMFTCFSSRPLIFDTAFIICSYLCVDLYV
uniref:Uncharacterized protein n=1 Tax=Arundo donax TaxID=35708 RepID=A0A0A8YB82_ARUDO